MQQENSLELSLGKYRSSNIYKWEQEKEEEAVGWQEMPGEVALKRGGVNLIKCWWDVKGDEDEVMIGKEHGDHW